MDDDLDGLDARRLAGLLSGSLVTQTIAAAAALGLAEALAGGPQTAAEAARAVDADPEGLSRLLGALAALGVVESPDGDSYSLTDMGQLLRADHPASLRSWAITQGQVMAPLWAGLLASMTTGAPAWQHAFGQPFYDHLAAHPALGGHWDRAMAETAVAWLDDDDLLGCVDWAGAEWVVDVGGGRGAMLGAILGRYPHLRGTLFDLAQVVGPATGLLAGSGVGDRAEVAAGSFFDAVPPGADVYLLARVIFNWADPEARAILGSCSSAMGCSARALVIDHVLTEEPGRDQARLNDLNLWAMGGRARTFEEWQTLAAAAGLEVLAPPRWSTRHPAWAALVLGPA